ncbi:MAG: hypothetical protein GWN18_19755, partial [Thermoplasmata archaeon]|nr:hypothetical protein [Thermoplasmata archaeon]NIS14375.1 hypothetical protein [Thermoplasmata archaeon]NIS22202.1 hypothetical protein [Thermoplasmata archaeon]NIT80100.1 hypothetical protein [Thermoplasmata archaeon]NIU51215.1 hypothetical protein [Thermoplasmata archaeon]
KGKEIVAQQKMEALQRKKERQSVFIVFVALIVIMFVLFAFKRGEDGELYFDTTVLFWGILIAIIILVFMRWSAGKGEMAMVP